MRTAITLLALASFSAVPGRAHTQEVPAPPTDSKPDPPPARAPTLPRARVTGSVLCADTRQPARGAMVILWSIPAGKEQNAATARTLTSHVTVAGTYAFEHVAPGQYAVVAIFPGYLSILDEIADQPASQADDEMRKILTARGATNVTTEGSFTADIVLERGAAISGRVLYSDGSPATQVNLLTEDTTRSGKRSADPQDPGVNAYRSYVRAFFEHQSMGTDDLGRFRISGIKPGTYYVAATQPTADDASTDPGMEMLVGVVGDPKAMRVYAGDTIHRSQAKKFELRGGDEVTGIEIRIPIDGFHSVRGIVNAIDGRPINMGSISLTDTIDDSLIFHATVLVDGTFHFASVPPGTYILAAKDAQIGALPAGATPENAGYMALTPTNAFADGTSSVLVKDADLTGVVLTLTEIPMPKTPPAPVVQSED